MNGLVEKNPVNEASGKQVRTRSNFNLTYNLFGTERFGELTPHFVMEGVGDDNLQVKSAHDVRSYTLKAPIMSDIFKNKAYFQVPQEAILPLNWEKIYTNPVNGEDIDAQAAGTNYQYLIARLRQVLGSVIFNAADPTDLPLSLNGAIHRLIMIEMIFSTGSLASSLGLHLNKFVEFNDGNGLLTRLGLSTDVLGATRIDSVFDAYMAYVVSNLASFQVTFQTSSSSFYVKTVVLNRSPKYNASELSLRDFLVYARDEFNWKITSVTAVDPSATLDFTIQDSDITWYYDGLSDEGGKSYDVARILAYQIVCAHFFTNDKIDYVYNAELYRQNVYDAAFRVFNYDSTTLDAARKFTLNGLTLQYDYLSNKVFSFVCDNAIYNGYPTDQNSYDAVCNYLRLIFGFNRSLRYVDYFTGCKSQPLAVGDVDIAVDTQNNTVNAIDVSRNIQMQRFLNAVNRVGRRFSEYMKEIMGTNVAPDWHNPFFLGLTKDKIYGSEVENTTVNPSSASESDQQVVTATFRGASEKYAFDIHLDRPSVIIGITYYDIPRTYVDNIDRHFFHVDRFDMFNPFMQFIGDQVVYSDELQAGLPHTDTFGYQLRHMEYKQRVSECFGAFSNGNLPGWTFTDDDGRSAGLFQSIGPDYIRSRPTELDKFYVSLTGYSLGTYFHFIVKNVNSVEASRPMAYAPSIL